MGLKRQLLDAVKEGYPEFNEETDAFMIEFRGSGDSFDSFSSIEVYNEGWNMLKGSFNLEKYTELLLSILDKSGADYDFNNAGTTGKISYQEYDDDGELNVETLLTYESYGSIADSEDEE